MSSKKEISEKEMEKIELTLKKTNFRKIEAARLIACDYSTFRRKIEKAFKENPEFQGKFPTIRFLYFRHK